MTEVMTEAEKIIGRGLMIETEESIFHSEADPEDTVTKQGHTEDKTIIEKEVTVDNKGSEVNPGHQLEGIELHQGLPIDIKTYLSVADSLVILQKNALRRIFLQPKCSIGKKELLSINDVPKCIKETQKKKVMMMK